MSLSAIPTCHVRRTFWVCHRSGSLQFSVSHLSSDSASGSSIPVKKTQVASPLQWALDNSLLCCKQTDTCHRKSNAAHPMRAEEIPLKRHSDTCPGISRSHSKGILILAVGLLHLTHIHSLSPLKSHTLTCLGIAMYIAHPLSVPA